MNYELLSSIYYKNREQYDKIYQQRFNSEASYKLPINLNDYKAFFIVTNELCTKIESIYLKNMQLENVCKQLPGVAMNKYILKNLVDEIMLTNDIEGIYSTRKEITDALNNNTSNKHARFIGIVKKYEKLISNDVLSLNNCEDIRKLYDDIALDEIDKNDLPDGAIFRKSEVSVYSATDKEKHKGIYPENSLIDFMTKSLEVLKDNNIAFLIRICIFHYLFGYAHPFYDGNGRVSRYISSYLLNNHLNILVALRISYTIKNNKSSYYKAFDDCNNKKNKGDITPFILMFLNVIENSLISLIEKLSEALEKLCFYDSMLRDEIFSLFNILHKRIIYILIQNALFADEGMDIDELTKETEKGNTLIRQNIKELQQKGIPIVITRSGKKLLYSIDLERFELLGNEIS
ncbi:Fic family protein [Ruminiclostridium herbifermentans]|uniref:Fic family protein n=1 Tax=Ruminiclostridium herbifermentans TaxID=2488810 RepID=A0A7H1VQI3_9FIRM|nr:Fic family protein [Ruminiclostridium herbifermentans]QNU67645.1 Fic family protein [Ruminiclostridium herbifermentans]